MSRPKCCRRIDGLPVRRIFKPVGVTRTIAEEITLAMNEFEAIRLADLEGLYHEQAAAVRYENGCRQRAALARDTARNIRCGSW